jgi:hypothetical protein
MTSAGMPVNLKLLLEHLNAVRELDRYLRKKGVDKDIARYVKEVFCPAIQERVPTLKAWHCDPDAYGAAWYPDSWLLHTTPRPARSPLRDTRPQITLRPRPPC